MQILAGILTLALSGFSWGQALNYIESLDGDLSDDYLIPSVLNIGEGNNFLTGTLSGGSQDLDLFQLVVPSGLEIFAIRIVEFSGGLNGSFLLLRPGDTLNKAPANITSSDVGFSILSAPTASTPAAGEDVLPTISSPNPLLANLPPFFGQATLTEGSYAGWLNETGPASSYTLNFETRALAVSRSRISYSHQDFCSL